MAKDNKKAGEVGKGGTFKVEQNNFQKSRTRGSASLSTCDQLGTVIMMGLMSGAFISFGMTSDGGAILIRVLDGDQKLSTYCSNNEELAEAMDALLEKYKPRGLNSSMEQLDFA